MAKAPAFQFYVKDWLSDPELQSTSSSTRGIWINALCYMWESVTRGQISGTIEELSKLLRSSNGDFDTFLRDIQRHKFADVTICNNEVTITNRRMFREQKVRENGRLRVNKFRNNAQSNAKVTPPSSSPSPSPNKERIIRKKVCDEEWLKELTSLQCYSHLNVNDQFEKCVAFFKTKNITVSRLRFLNWLNNPKYNSKPITIESTKPKGPPARIMMDGVLKECIKGEWVEVKQ